jgi:hypothetical protein
MVAVLFVIGTHEALLMVDTTTRSVRRANSNAQFGLTGLIVTKLDCSVVFCDLRRFLELTQAPCNCFSHAVL